MKPMKVKDCFDPKFNEYIVGPKQTESRGTYLVYGEVEAGKERSWSNPGEQDLEMLVIKSREEL